MTRTFSKTVRACWIEITVGLLAFSAAFVVWRVLDLHERHHIRHMVSVATSTIEADLLADMHEYLDDQIYLAEHAKFEDAQTPDWKAHVARYREQNPWCSDILWLNNEQQMGLLAPASQNEEVLSRAVLEHGSEALAQALLAREPRVTHSFQSPTGETLGLTAVPVLRDGKHIGFLLFFTNWRSLLDFMLDDISQMGYNMAVYDGDRELYRLADSARNEQQWGQGVFLQFPGVTWRMKAWPRSEALREEQSPVPPLMFGVVSVLGVVLVLAVHFERVARSESKSADAVNQQLTNEIAERQHIEAALRESQARLTGMLQTSADGIISTDAQFRITFFNGAAEQIFGYRADEVLGQPLDVLLPPRFRQEHAHHMARFAAGARETMLMGERGSVVGRRKDGSEFPADAAISKLKTNGEIILTAFLRDVTARVAAQEALRKAHEELEHRVAERTTELAVANASLHQLSGHLLQSQEDERRRIARELHDSTAGNLVLIGMALDKMRTSDAAAQFGQSLEECWRWVRQTLADIRTLSYRLHPPMLEGLGLGSALRWYVSGFSERSGIDILLRVDQQMPRLSRETELTLFRIVQESLTNIHRHAQSDSAEISVACEESRVALRIADHGIGIRPELLSDDNAMLGVGIAGMRERVQQLGGELEVQSSASGTTITATLPLTTGTSSAMA